MGAYILTVGSFKMKVQAGKQVRRYENDTHVHLDELAVYKFVASIKALAEAGLVKLIAAYAYRIEQQLKLEIEDYPPHSIFCECKGCVPKQWMGTKTRKGTR